MPSNPSGSEKINLQEETTLESVLEDLRKRIRTQNLRLEQMKTNAYESKCKAKICIQEEDVIGAKGWIVKSKQEDYARKLEWDRYLNNTQMLATLEQAVANLEQSKNISRAGTTLEELLTAMPKDLTLILDKVKTTMEKANDVEETLSYQPSIKEVEEELADIERVMKLTSLPPPPSSLGITSSSGKRVQKLGH